MYNRTVHMYYFYIALLCIEQVIRRLGTKTPPLVVREPSFPNLTFAIRYNRFSRYAQLVIIFR